MHGPEAHRAGVLAILAGFAVPLGLTLVPLLPLPRAQPWLGLAVVLALPFYLLAVVQATGCRYEPGYLAAARARVPASLLQLLGACALSALLLAWPAWRLQQTGALGAVLMLSAAAAVVLIVLWRVWPAFGLVFLWQEGGSMPAGKVAKRSFRMARQLLDSGNRDMSGAGLLASSAMLLWLLGALALAVAAAVPWLAPDLRLGLSLVYALLLAPLAAWVLIEITARRLLREQPEPADAGFGEQLDEDAPDPATLPFESLGDVSLTDRLYAAARAGRVDDALSLLELGADACAAPDPTARDQRSLAMLAALLPDLRLLRALIGRGVDINLRHAGLTALLLAARDSYHGRPDAVMTLLANGADPRQADSAGRTALHGASLSADPAVAALLLDAEAPIDATDHEGWSALGIACRNGNWRMAKFLLQRGARTDPEPGQPALIAAAGGEDDAAGVNLLLKHKARIDARGRLNRSALHAACLGANVEIVQALIEAGADVNARDEHGVTPLLEAARAGSAATLRVLATRQPDVGVTDSAGRNALAIACQSRSADSATVEALLALGADPAQACRDGRVPIEYAVAAGRWSLVARIDPHYPLPACVADATEELNDVPLPARLRLALEAHRHDHLRELLPLLAAEPEQIAAVLIELAPRLDPISLRMLLDACGQVGSDADGDSLLFRLLRRGPAATRAIRALIERGASVGGRMGLAHFLAAGFEPDIDADAAEALTIDLVAWGADAFGARADGATPLLLAIRLDWPRLVAALLATGVDPEARDGRGSAPLLTACALGHEDSVRQLVAHGAQPGARATDGQTALGLALASGRHEIARWLDWNLWPLPRRRLREADLPAAAHAGDHAAVQRLLDLGLSLDALDAQGCSALLRASGGGHLGLVELLLQRGADPGIAARSGATCLSAALSARQHPVVQVLLARGAAPDQALPGGVTTLMVAAALGQVRGVEILLAHGADVGCCAADGGTALHAAAQFGFGARERSRALALWEALLTAGGNADAVTTAGHSPLLLLLGARIEAGATVVEDVVAAQVERLLAHGVLLAQRERRGFSALHLAALHGMGTVVRLLLAAGADPDARDNVNRRAQEIALMRGFVDIAAEFDSPRAAPSIARFLRPS